MTKGYNNNNNINSIKEDIKNLIEKGDYLLAVLHLDPSLINKKVRSVEAFINKDIIAFNVELSSIETKLYTKTETIFYTIK